MPEQPFFRDAVGILVLSALFFLFNLNVVLQQLGAMLPDETLRLDMRQFTALNRWMLVAWLGFVAAFTAVPQTVNLSAHFGVQFLLWLQHVETTVLLFLGLAPLAITMALIWKTKEVILDSVFARQ